MKAMLFAAGMGTRLKPLTDTMPKALVPVGGTPLIEHVIAKLIKEGTDEIVVNVHHFSEQIINYINQHNWPIPIRISDESNGLLDTGGGLKHAQTLFTPTPSPILIHNVDILSNANLKNFYQQSKNYDANLLVSRRNTQRYLLFDENMMLCGWTNKATGEVRSPYPHLNPEKYQAYAFSGIHTFSPSLFPFMENRGEKFPIIDFYLSICDKVKIHGTTQPNLQLMDVGKINTLHEAEAFITTLT